MRDDSKCLSEDFILILLNVKAKFLYQLKTTVKSTIGGSLGDEWWWCVCVWLGGYFQSTSHKFSFQSPVSTKRSPVIHFYHNPLVSMFSVKTVTDAKYRRQT